MGIIIVLAIAGGIIYLIVTTNSRSEARGKWLYDDYQKALASDNKGHASLAGRAYYAYLRKGLPTLQDEQALLDDIAAMH
ncbi:hypothetical protein [Spirosoma flavum]|uniref:Uncharacterized protein n=1 Tax=Spirosoma flavum TaxID=2048557 RepID=A0ABW6AGK0_9BACT